MSQDQRQNRRTCRCSSPNGSWTERNLCAGSYMITMGAGSSSTAARSRVRTRSPQRTFDTHRLAERHPAQGVQRVVEGRGQVPEVPPPVVGDGWFQGEGMPEPGDEVRVGVLVGLAGTPQVVQQPGDVVAICYDIDHFIQWKSDKTFATL